MSKHPSVFISSDQGISSLSPASWSSVYFPSAKRTMANATFIPILVIYFSKHDVDVGFCLCSLCL